MIKMMAFDCWGTLFGNSKQPHPFTVFAQKIGQDINNREFLQLFEQSLMTDKYDDLKPPIKKILQKLGLAPSPDLIQTLEQILISSIPGQMSFAETIDSIEHLHHKYRLAMITNTFSQGFDALVTKYELTNYFEFILTSFEQHVTKPSPEMFITLLKRSGLKVDEILFVGDSLESDIVPAKKFGFKTILIDRKNRYPSYISSINDLSEIKRILSS